MKIEITGDLAMLDRKTQNAIAAAPRRIFGRLNTRISQLNVRVSHLIHTSPTLCEVTVLTADRVQVMARHRDSDALKAVLQALERARPQVSQALLRARQRRMARLAADSP